MSGKPLRPNAKRFGANKRKTAVVIVTTTAVA